MRHSVFGRGFGGGGSGSGALPAGMETTITNTTDGEGFIFLRPNDYDTTYTNESKTGQWVFSTYNSANSYTSAPSRLDRVFFQGYGVDVNSTGQTAKVAGEPGWFQRLETNWLIDDPAVGGLVALTSAVDAGGGTTTITATGAFTSGATALNNKAFIWFATGGRKYLITSVTSANVAVVANGTGDPTTEAGNLRVLVRSFEFHMGPIWMDGTACRMFDVNMFLPTKRIDLGFRCTNFTVNAVDGTLVVAVDDQAGRGIIYEKNNRYLIFDTAALSRRNCIGINASDVLIIGDASSALATTFYSTGITVPTGELTLSAGGVTTTKSGTTSTAILAGTTTYSGSGTQATVFRGIQITATDAGSGASRTFKGLDVSASLSGSAGALGTTANKVFGVRSNYGKTAASTLGGSATAHYFVGFCAVPIVNTGDTTGTRPTVAQVDFFSPGPTGYGGNYTDIALSAAFGGDVLIATGQRLYFEGSVGTPQPASDITAPTQPSIGDTQIRYNSGATQLEVTVNGALGATFMAGGYGLSGTNASAVQTGYSVSNPTEDRSLDVTGNTLAQGLAVLGTLITDLITKGVIAA